MVWAKIDDAILDNAKIAKVGVFGFAMHVAAITWCCRNLTDGFVPTARVTVLLTLQNVNIDCANPLALVGGPTSMGGQTGLDPFIVADALVAAGLWDVAEGGYQLHDFLVYNPSKEEVLSTRAKNSVRAAKYRSTPKSNAASNGVTNAVRNTASNAANTPLPVPVPVTTNTNPPIGSPPSPVARVRRGSRLPADWVPSPDTLAALSAEGCTNAKDALPSFRDYWNAVPGAKGVKLDWEGTYRNWCRRDSGTRNIDRSSKVQRGLAAHTALSIAKNDLMAELDAKDAQEGGYDASF